MDILKALFGTRQRTRSRRINRGTRGATYMDRKVAERTGRDPQEVRRIRLNLQKAILEEIDRGYRVVFRNFCRFEIIRRSARTIRGPDGQQHHVGVRDVINVKVLSGPQRWVRQPGPETEAPPS